MASLDWLRQLVARLMRVDPVLPGRERDGLVSGSAGTSLDKPWTDLLQEFTDTRESWRRNPMTRRFVTVTTAYVIGDGVQLASDRPELAEFIAAFWAHPQNGMARRQFAMCDELTRAGEIFVSLHLNRADGMSYVRLLPASRIDKVETAAGDYETELAYHEEVGPDDPDYPEGRRWLAAGNAQADAARPDGRFQPVVVHFAVNRPPGCVRGESDLVPVFSWLRRYQQWLEDRVRLNAGVRSFLWLVKVPGVKVEGTKERLRTPPEPGTVQVIDKDTEEWEPLAPSLNASDAAEDGRALRWMVAAGSLGLSLVDFGEGDEANLATAKVQGELRARVLQSRRAYFCEVLATIVVTAYNRAVSLGLVEGELAEVGDVRVVTGDLGPADNAEMGQGAASIADAFATTGSQGLAGETWRRLILLTLAEYAGVEVSDEDVDKILAESEAERTRAERAAERAAREAERSDEDDE